MVAALDIGGTRMRAALIEAGRVVWRAETATDAATRAPADVLAAALSLFDGRLEAAASLGVALTGRVIAGVAYPLNQQTLPGWQGFKVQAYLKAATAKDVMVLNDARAAAYGEWRYGAGRSYSEFMFVTVSTGVGAGLVLGSRLHLAANGLDAELGFVRPTSGETLEAAVSGTALTRQAQAHGWTDANALVTAAEQGDAVAAKIYDGSIALLAAQLANLSVLLGLQGIAVGGGVGLRPSYLPKLRSALPLPAGVEPPALHRALLGEDAGLIGVAALLAQRLSGVQ
jgi:N-acylmannosamine kinase